MSDPVPPFANGVAAFANGAAAPPALHGADASIKSWPSDSRPREKMLELGPTALTDSELLALFLRTGLVGCSAVDLSRRLLSRFGSLHRLLDATSEELLTVQGIGPAKVAQLRAIGEILGRALRERLRARAVLDSPQAVSDYLRLKIGARPYEVFFTLYLDARLRLILAEESSRGTITHTTIYPREIVRQALSQNASTVIIAHNHPSGDPSPSPVDRNVTRRLCEALALFDIRLLDHLVIGAGQAFSFSEQGLL